MMMSPASANHGSIAMELARQLANYVGERRIGRVFASETGFLIQRDPDTVLAPDVAFVRQDRLKDLPDQGYFPGAPDLAVEVLSPGDTAPEVLEKVELWLSAGCAQVWIVNPRNHAISAYLGDGHLSVYHEEEEVDGGDLLPGFRLLVSSVFSWI